MTRSLFGALLLVVLFAVPVAARSVSAEMSMQGTWAYTYEGSVYPFMPDGTVSSTPLPIVLIGVVSIAADGTIDGGGTGIMGTQTIDYEFVNSKIEAGAGYTATATWSLRVPGMGTVPGQGIDRLVIIAREGEMRATSVQGVFGKPVYLGTWKRIDRSPSARQSVDPASDRR